MSTTTLPKPTAGRARSGHTTTKIPAPSPATERSGHFDGMVLAIDPGVSGGYVLIDHPGVIVDSGAWGGVPSMAQWVRVLDGLKFTAVIEQVHASPVMSPSSCFAFGENFGQWIGILAALGVTTYGIRPQEWQCQFKRLAGIQGPERKRILKDIASKGFPGERVTLKTCDAFLIGQFAIEFVNKHGHLPGKVIQ